MMKCASRKGKLSDDLRRVFELGVHEVAQRSVTHVNVDIGYFNQPFEEPSRDLPGGRDQVATRPSFA